jgi:FixJ family two-component response regulator
MGEIEPTVFVVDDETVIATILAIILKQSGFAATAFSDPLEVLDAAQKAAPTLRCDDAADDGNRPRNPDSPDHARM